jgi:pentatricopeptide repeat protein
VFLKPFKYFFPSLLSASALFSSAFAADSGLVKVDPLTQQATALFNDGKLDEAIALETESLTQRQGDWLPHATMSYFVWRQGNVLASVSEGQEAVRLAPQNFTALTNLAQMEEGFEDCHTAIPLYDRARKLRPNDWVPWLGMARCYIKSGNMQQGLDVLADMKSRGNNSFDWCYQVADTYLRVDQPQLAAEAAARARNLASATSQKADSASLLLKALVRSNQLEQARELKDYVFSECHPKDYELYVRSASTLLPVTDPDAGNGILKSALENLNSPDDAEGLFRLGMVFQDKANLVSFDAAKFAAWSGNARSAYKQSIRLNPELAKVHLSLASVLDPSESPTELTEALNKTVSLDSLDTIAPYLIARLKANSIGEGGRVNLTKAIFKISGLTCSCHISKFIEALGKIPGVAFATIPSQNPDQGVVLVDSSVAPVDELFPKCVALLQSNDVLKASLAGASFTVVSRQPVERMQEAIRIAQNAKYDNILKFYDQFGAVKPVMPVEAVEKVSLSAK